MKKILVPCDFYEPSRQAFKFAVQLAERSKGEVYVLKVNELPVIYEPGLGMPQYGFDAGLLGELEEDARNKLTSLKSKFGVNHENIFLLTEVGAVNATILRIIDEKNIDTVVMGTHGAGNWIDSFVGSNTEKIVRSSPVPVFTIRKAIPLDKIKDIVLPGILPLNQAKVVQQVKTLQTFFNANLHLLYVNTPTDFHSDNEIRRAMDEFVKHFKLNHCTLNIFNEMTEEKGIISFMEYVKGDLIAMPTHGRRGLSHLFNHSITEEILSKVMWPLWTTVMRK